MLDRCSCQLGVFVERLPYRGFVALGNCDHQASHLLVGHVSRLGPWIIMSRAVPMG